VLAASRMLDDFVGNRFPDGLRVVRHEERTADFVERDRHGVRRVGGKYNLVF
jgi:hypothetical protein